MSGGIGRRSSCLKWDLSGKPTFSSVLLKDGWETAYDPKQAHKEKPPEGGLWNLGGPGRNRPELKDFQSPPSQKLKYF